MNKRNRTTTSFVDDSNGLQVQVFSTASVQNAFTASFDGRYVLTSSYSVTTGSLTVFTASLNTFTASVNKFTASLNTFTASVSTFTASLSALSATFFPVSASLAFWGAGNTLSGATALRLQQFNATAFNVGVSVTNALIRDANVPFQIDSTATGYYGANKNGAYGLLMGYDQSGYGGGVIRMVTSDPLTFVTNNSTLAGNLNSSGEWYLKNNTYVTGTLKTSSNVFLSGGLLHVNSALNTVLLNLSVGTPTQQALIQFMSQSGVKYQLGKDGSDNFYLYDIQNNFTVYTYSSSSRIFNFGANVSVAGNLNNCSAFRQQVTKGFLSSTLLVGTTTFNTVQVVYGASNVDTYFIAPFSGSLSAVTGKTYNTNATAGTLTVGLVKGTTTMTTVTWTAAQLNAAVASTFVPGAFTFAANDQIILRITGSNFAQAGNGCEFALFVHM